MKARYFSPSSKASTASNCSTEAERKLKTVVSTSKLVIPSKIIHETEQCVGKYSYRLDRLIGEGSSSKVYLGHLTDNVQDDYAVKAIDLRKFRPADLQLLQNEISILRQLDHPNIIELYDVIRTKNFCYLITEYCPDQDLMTYLLKNNKLDEEESLSILNDIIEGYKYLSKRNILHRDLKPANILKGSFNWKIADFGFAIKTEHQHKSKGNVGTPLYMPPESLVKNLYSTKSDIFSIGIIFYEMLTGTTPWECKTEKELLRKMLNNPFHVPSHYYFTEQVSKILEKLCCVDAKKRMSKDVFSKFTVHTVYNQTTLHRGNVTQTEIQSESLELSASLNLAAFMTPQTPIQMLMSSQQMAPNSELFHSNCFVKQKRDGKSVTELSEEAAIYNNKIMVNQLHYCRYIYYLIRNTPYFPLSEQEKIKLSLLLYKHLLQLIGQVSDPECNWFSLHNWQEFVKSKRYSATSFTLKQYRTRYQDQASIYREAVESDEITQINKDLERITDGQLTIDSYEFIKAQVTQVIRVYKLQMDLEILNTGGDCKQLRGQIQGIRSLVKYRKFIQFSMSHFQKFDYFQKQTDIKVQNDYQSVTSATKANYITFRKELGFL